MLDRRRHGTKSSLRHEPDMRAELLRALFGNVTKPNGRLHHCDCGRSCDQSGIRGGGAVHSKITAPDRIARTLIKTLAKRVRPHLVERWNARPRPVTETIVPWVVREFALRISMTQSSHPKLHARRPQIQPGREEPCALPGSQRDPKDVRLHWKRRCFARQSRSRIAPLIGPRLPI